MLLNQKRAQDLLTEAALDGVILVTEPNIIYSSDLASEYMLGRFDDYTHAVILPRSPDVAPALIIPDNDMPHVVEVAPWIEDIYAYGNEWSSIGRFIGETLEARLDTPFRHRLQQFRSSLKDRKAATLSDAIEKALADRGLLKASLGCDDMAFGSVLRARGIGGAREISFVRQLMRTIRAIKTAEEIEILTQGANINGGALMKAAGLAHAGVSEVDVIRGWRIALEEQDARHSGERGMLFGTGDASAFYLPSDSTRRLENGDPFVLDCIGSYKRYFMDMARTAIVGEPSKAQRDRYRAVHAAATGAIEATRPGVHTADIAAIICRTIEGFGFRSDTTSALTHGIGLEVFEFPTSDGLANGFLLEEGMVVNSEVFYRDPELGGFHLEDTVVVTKDGCRLLCNAARDLIVV
jgi:Xaa-Pro aminopeptidase